ncbi:helix-turn-helix transcriptional regulator [Rhizobium sp. KVB221]|uniref:Helix-turn-helix transcriptional regulator n=1 Tax=Rhizobium setariae TaxID=2801340 RepID=A0A937CPZ3_9HYPH|nr:helix-turn-helix transcriptional regulator [Rhizobium setariae]MBL0373163.1 helix-turn-helix transcriptional regulator [Rhizobium setariae]
MSNPETNSFASVSSPNPALVFSALGDRTRLSLLRKLSGGDSQSIARLSVDSNLTRQAVTKHLKVLEDAGLVAVSRIGRESQYTLQPKAIAAARCYLEEVAQLWGDARVRLLAFVEE